MLHVKKQDTMKPQRISEVLGLMCTFPNKRKLLIGDRLQVCNHLCSFPFSFFSWEKRQSKAVMHEDWICMPILHKTKSVPVLCKQDSSLEMLHSNFMPFLTVCLMQKQEEREGNRLCTQARNGLCAFPQLSGPVYPHMLSTECVAMEILCYEMSQIQNWIQVMKSRRRRWRSRCSCRYFTQRSMKGCQHKQEQKPPAVSATTNPVLCCLKALQDAARHPLPGYQPFLSWLATRSPCWLQSMLSTDLLRGGQAEFVLSVKSCIVLCFATSGNQFLAICIFMTQAHRSQIELRPSKMNKLTSYSYSPSMIMRSYTSGIIMPSYIQVASHLC